MRILHMADLHFGIDLYKTSMIEDQSAFLLQLEAIIIAQHVDVVMICGDIYDTMLASKEAIEIYDKMVTMLCMQLHKKVIVIAGNHDSATRLSSCRHLLQESGLYVYGKVDAPICAMEIEDVCIYPIPFFHNDTIARVYGQKILNTEAAFQCMLDPIRASMDPNKTHIVMAHAYIQGGVCGESDRFASLGGSDYVHADVFQGFDYVALGHLHRLQKIREHIWYSGSPLAYGFQESTYKKGVIIYDTKQKSVETHSIKPLHVLQTYTDTFDALRQRTYEDEQAYVRLEVSDMMISYDMLLYFRERIPNLLSLQSKKQEEKVETTLQMEAFDTLRDEDILRQFYRDLLQKEIDEDEMNFFLAAYKKDTCKV